MEYLKWFQLHGAKHANIVRKLVEKNMTKDETIDYFDFDNMVKNEPDFCPLYKDNKKCHDSEKLNCYLCACPNFRFCDNGIFERNGLTVISGCSIHSKEGKEIISAGEIHQDCSKCTVPHHTKYIQKYFDLDWFKIMNWCAV